MWSPFKQKGKADPLMGLLMESAVEKGPVSRAALAPAPAPAVNQPTIGEIQRINQLDGLKGITSRFKTRYRYSKFFAPKVWVLWADRNFTVWHAREMDWIGDGLVADSWWGRAADIIGSNCYPVQIVVKGKAATGFLVDGDKGVGFNIKRGPTGAAETLYTTSELCWATLDTKKIAEAYTADPTLRTKIIFVLIGIIMGFILGGMFR